MQFPNDTQDMGISLKNYDGSRSVNTPNSLLACRLEGVLPIQLVKTEPPASMTIKRGAPPPPQGEDNGENGRTGSAGQQRKSPPQVDIDAEKAAIKYRFLERERKAVLQTVKTRYDSILSSGNGATLQPTKPSSSANNNDESRSRPQSGDPREKPLNMSGSAKIPQGLSKTPRGTSSQRKQKPEDETDAAQYFLLLKKVSDQQGQALERWKQKEDRIAELNAKLAKERQEKSEKSSKAFEQRLEKAKKNHETNQRTLTLRTKEKMAHLDEKLEKADVRKKSLHPKMDSNRGAAEAEAVQRRREEQLKKLQDKIDRANETSRRMAEKREHDRELKSYENELVTIHQEEQASRNKRMREFRREQINKKVEEDRERKAQRDLQMATEEKERSLRSEKIAREKEEIARYVEEHKWETDVKPPAWLADQMKTLENNKHKRQTTSSSSPRKPAAASQKASSGGDDFYDQTSRVPKPPKEKFSVAASQVSQKQTFPRWMYD